MKRNASIVMTVLTATSVFPSQASAETPPPNILFAIADDWGFPHASAYGTRWVKTPAFDRVARDGILFTRAYTPNAKCAPSRACILTGRNSWQLKEAANHVCYFPAEFKGWAEVLAERDWHVGYTTKGWGPGIAIGADGQPRRMTGLPFNQRTAKPPTDQMGNSDYAANFDDFLAVAPAGKPWCFWYGAIEPHRDYEFGSGVAKGGKKLTDIGHVPAYWPDNPTVRNDMLDYAFEVEHFDRQLGRMLASLEQRGLLDSTLVIVTSDHGMPFPRCKGNAYESANQCSAWAAMWPRGIAAPGRVIDDFVSFVDFAPAFIELAGLKWANTGLAASPGRSLTDIFRSEQAGQVNSARDHVLIGMERHDVGRPKDVGYPIRGIVRENSLYLHNFEPTRWPACNPETGYLNCDGGPTKSLILEAHRRAPDDRAWAFCFGKRPSEEFYDLRHDPDCIRNLASDPNRAPTIKQIREVLFDELRNQSDPRMSGDGHLFDEYPYANPDQRGFYERFMNGEKLKAGWVSPSDFEPTKLD